MFLYAKTERASFITAKQRIGSDRIELRYSIYRSGTFHLLASWLSSGWYLWYPCMSGTIIILLLLFFSVMDVMDCCRYLARCSQRIWRKSCRGWSHRACSNHNMIHPSSSSNPVDQSIPTNWEEKKDLYSSAQTVFMTTMTGHDWQTFTFQ